MAGILANFWCKESRQENLAPVPPINNPGNAMAGLRCHALSSAVGIQSQPAFASFSLWKSTCGTTKAGCVRAASTVFKGVNWNSLQALTLNQLVSANAVPAARVVSNTAGVLIAPVRCATTPPGHATTARVM